MLDAERFWSTRDDREGAPREILIVDDEEDVRWLLATMLREYRFEPVEARNGQEALERLEVRSPAVILMDVRMPILDGVSALKKIRADHPDIPIVMITAYGDIGSAVEAMKLGAYDYVTKPFDNAHIVRAVFGALQRGAAEKAWRESYVLLRAIVEGTGDTVFVKDRRGRYLLINTAGARLFGRSVEEIVGKDASDLFSPDGAREIMERDRSVIATGGTVTYEETAEIAGAVRTCLSTTGVYRDHQGNIVGLIGISRDITERKRAAALRESDGVYHSLFWGMPEGIALCEILYDERGEAHDYRILYINPAYEGIFGVTKEEAVGNKALETYRTGCLSHLELYARVVATGEPATFITTFGPTQRSFRITALAAGNGRFATVFEDITERKDLEQRFYQAQKMDEFGRLASGVAHDFNNLLTAILGYSELVLDRVRDQSDVAADIEEIKKAGERASQLTRQLLAFSRKELLVPHVLDLNQVVGSFEKMLSRVIREDIRFDIVAAPSLGRTKADPGQIEQLLMNLVVNARDAMPQGGTLTIATANVVLDSEFTLRHVGAVPGRYVSLTVQDTGCGMTPDVLACVFEPFFTTKELGKGTGLGLSTVYGLVKQSGGYITVESTPGVGTTVTTYLPTVDDPVESAAAAPRSVQTLEGTETILLVEDETGVRNLMQRVLEWHSYTVLPARDTGDAIAIEDSYRGAIDLLVSDLIMPGLGGPDLAQRIVRRRPAIKVLFVSGYRSREATDLGVSSQNASFLQKPFRPETLARKVRERLDGHVGQPGRESTSV